MNNCFPNGSTTSTTDNPRCGACVYWSGKRNWIGNLVEYDQYETSRCNNTMSPAYGQDVPAEHGCGMKKDF